MGIRKGRLHDKCVPGYKPTRDQLITSDCVFDGLTIIAIAVIIWILWGVIFP